MPSLNTHQTARPRQPHRRGGTVVWVVVGGLLMSGVGYVTYLGVREKPDKPTLTRSELATVTKTSFEVATLASGELEARNKIEIRSPLEDQSSIVWIIPEGVVVKAGERLIQLNADPIKQKVDEETLRLESAKAELVAAENSYSIQANENQSRLSQAELKVALAELALRQWREGEVAKKRQDLALAIDKATLEIDRLAERFVRSQSLLADGFISKDECDRDEVAYIEAISAYNTAHLSRDIYENYEYPKEEKTKISDLEQARSELERVRLNNEIELASKDASRQNRRSQATIIENKLNKIKADYESATIKAPRDGLVVYATTLDRDWRGGGDGGLQIGQQVWSNQLLIVLPDTSEMVATVRVHESLASRVTPGLSVAVKVDAANGRVFQGVVESIGVMAASGGWRDPNLREYSVRIGLTDHGDGLKPAMRAEARIVLEKVNDALAAPISAVFQDGAVQYVCVPRGAKYVRVPIRLGRRSDTQAEILAGVDAGASVLLREPAAGEVLSQPWDTAQLTLAGYTIGDNGDITSPASRGPGGEGRRRRTSPSGDGTKPAEESGDASAPGGTAASQDGETDGGKESPAASPAATGTGESTTTGAQIEPAKSGS